jgi:glycerate 2-kinase
MMARDQEPQGLRRRALEIFYSALKSVDAADAIRGRVRLNDSQLTVFDTTYDLDARATEGIYAVAIGKAAFSMAAALDEILCERLAGGVVAASSAAHSPTLSSRWKVFAGGHPLPNKESLSAARRAIDLLRRADHPRAIVIFLISGGGSATFEWPCDERITLEDLREANRTLVSCGATIGEINAVRLRFSAVKGGRLAGFAPRAAQLSLIVSDTNRGEESRVASGPTLPEPEDMPDPSSVIKKYELERRLPPSVLRAVRQPAIDNESTSAAAVGKHYLLLDNRTAIEAAASAARAQGFDVEIAEDIVEQPIQEGCSELLSRLRSERARRDRPFCLISGGEFACPVRGEGIGGRNLETALRLALEMDARRKPHTRNNQRARSVVLSAGTDGVDGNSPAAGAIADETTIERARSLGLDAQSYLERSDAYTFFEALGEAIMTGPTGTNVRDLRVMIAE